MWPGLGSWSWLDLWKACDCCSKNEDKETPSIDTSPPTPKLMM